MPPQDLPFLHTLRRARTLMRATAAGVGMAFSLLILAPTATAVRAEATRAPQGAGLTPSDEAAFGATLGQLERRLGRFEAALAERRDSATEAQALRRLGRELERLDRRLEANFAAVEAQLAAQALPTLILERHRAMRSHYRQEIERLFDELQALEEASDAPTRHERAQRLRAYLKAHPGRRAQQPFDPEDLPNRTLRPRPEHKPRLERRQFRAAGLHDHPRVRLAALGDFRFDGLPGADDPAYLAPSDEVTRSAAIAAQAAALAHDPVRIYHWVRNHIEWRPGWGAQQNADLTLATRRGNALDIASLLLALLRASGIPSRYVHGTIEVPAERFRNWAGGFSSTRAAAEYAASTGLPVSGVVAGGDFSAVQLEHVWVEAALDYYPSRGARNRVADRWVALDPSFKQYQRLPGLDVLTLTNLDPQALAQQFLDSGQVDATEGWAGGFDAGILETAQRDAQAQLQDYLQAQQPATSVGELVGAQPIIVQDAPVLPAALPNRVLVEGARYARLPPALQQRITFAFGRDRLGELIAPLTLPWARLNNQKLTLSFRPASEADAQALEALLPAGEVTDPGQLPASLPAYLIEVIPELRHDGALLMAGAPMTLGEELTFSFNPTLVGQGTLARHYRVVAGAYLAIAVVSGRVSPARLEATRARLAQTQAALESADPARRESLTRDALLGDLFHAGLLGYYAQYLAFSQLVTWPQQAHQHLAAGLGSFGYEPEVSYLFGFPRTLEPGGAVMNLPLVRVLGTDPLDAARYRQLNLQLGLLSSALEHAVPEQLFTTDPTNPADAVSAVKALAKANAVGQRLYHLTPTNLSETLPHIHHDEAVLEEIRTAVQHGREVITHTDAIGVPGWSGAGYIILDPETGEGAYKIGGGQNGGYFAAGVFFGTAMGSVLFYIDGAITADAYPHAAAGLAVLLEQILIAYLAYELYGIWGGAQAQKCFISGIGVGLMAAGVTLEGMNTLLKILSKKFPASAPQPVAVSSFIVTLVEASIGWQLANHDSSPVYKCID